MFRGVNNLSLDAKGRLAIPTRYRESLADCCAGHLVVTVDIDHCLLLYPLPDWEEVEQKLLRLPSLDRRARALQRLMTGHATDLDMDSQGRVLLTSPLREFAGLDRRVVLIGQGNKFELWDETLWTESRENWLEKMNEGDELPEELANLSL